MQCIGGFQVSVKALTDTVHTASDGFDQKSWGVSMTNVLV